MGGEYSRPGQPLTDRQVDALAAYAKHGNRSDAAAELGISPNTLRHHLEQAYMRLGVDNFAAALRRIGWLVVPEDRA